MIPKIIKENIMIETNRAQLPLVVSFVLQKKKELYKIPSSEKRSRFICTQPYTALRWPNKIELSLAAASAASAIAGFNLMIYSKIYEYDNRPSQQHFTTAASLWLHVSFGAQPISFLLGRDARPSRRTPRCVWLLDCPLSSFVPPGYIRFWLRLRLWWRCSSMRKLDHS